MKKFKKDKIFFEFSSKNTPSYFINSGEIFELETDDCYCGQINSENILRTDIDISIMDAAVGPIYIENATPNDTIEIEILDINFSDYGVMVTSPGLGVLGDLIKTPNTKIIPIKNNKAYFSKDIVFPLKPMIGVLGVAPKNNPVHCAIPGDHGRNMDTKEVTIGSKVYLPVFHEGALLGVADLHSCMGDGELSGTGIETAGVVTLKVNIIKNFLISSPVIETYDSIFFVNTDSSFEKSIKNASKLCTEFIKENLSISFEDAYRILSATCDIRVSQVVNGVITTKVKLPKYIINWSSFYEV